MIYIKQEEFDEEVLTGTKLEKYAGDLRLFFKLRETPDPTPDEIKKFEKEDKRIKYYTLQKKQLYQFIISERGYGRREWEKRLKRGK